jgi:hypothetical protein
MHKNQKKNVKSLKNKIFYRDLIFLFFSCSVYFVEVNLIVNGQLIEKFYL